MSLYINKKCNMQEPFLNYIINRNEFVKFAEEAMKDTPPPSTYPFSKNCFMFFVMDIVEWNAAQPGHLYLFGKTYNHIENSYVSCCVSIKYCHKRIYLLPRKYFSDNPSREVTWQDVLDEFSENIIPKIETREIVCNHVTKKYAFDDNVPAEADYLEVVCKVGNFKLRDKPGNTYSKILGINTGYKETFMLERCIKGPCWVEISNYKIDVQSATNCTVNIECNDIENITAINTHLARENFPPITLMGLEFTTFKDKETNEEKIVSVSCIVETFTKINSKPYTTITDYFCILSTRSFTYGTVIEDCGNTYAANINIADDEVHLLMQLFGYIGKFDSDILYGHNMIDNNVELIYSKIADNEMILKNYYKLPKLKLSKIPSAKYKMDLFIGRILYDTKIIAEELVKSRSYSVHDLTVDILQLPHYDFEDHNLGKTRTEDVYLANFIYTIMWDIACIHKFLEKFEVMDLLVEISRICGNTLQCCCDGYVSNRCEYLLLHKFHARNHIVPSRFINRSKTKTGSLAGGLVLEPGIGLHKNYVISLDFNALYPSIIQEYNICFTTVTKESIDVNEEGVLPQLVGDLLRERKNILEKLSIRNQPGSSYENLKIKQGVIKRMANSIYGYLGCNGARFMAKHLANLITQKGRTILSHTVTKLEDSYNIIYGDTDSVMIKTDSETYQKADELADVVQEMINSQYKHVNIGKAGIYKPLLILRKKKYAAMEIKSDGTSNIVIKGIDIVRRDWSVISATTAEKVLKDILTRTENLANIICKYLRYREQDLIHNYRDYDDTLFTICKKLSKDPEKYSNKENYEHVRVACEYNQRYPNKFKAHDIVSYVVCVDGSSRPYTERAYHIEDFRKSDYLTIDVNYYISQQIYPVVKRICEGIKDVVTNKDLLCALNIDSHSCDIVDMQHCKKRKTNPVVKYNHMHNFIIVCNTCEMDILFAYDTFEFIKLCNCNRNPIQNFKVKLNLVAAEVLRTYKLKSRTFKEADFILSRLSSSIQQFKQANDQFHEYMIIIEDYKNQLMKDFDCKNLNSKDLFQCGAFVTF